METVTLEEALATFPEIVSKLSTELHQLKIVTPEGSVVVLSEETYENILVTLEFLSTPGLLDGFRDKQLAPCHLDAE